MTARWHVYVKGCYIASCDATEAEIRAAFPWANVYVIGHAVNVWAVGGKR